MLSLLFRIPMRNLDAILLRLDVLGKRVRDEDRPVPASRAADRNRDVRLPFLFILRKQEIDELYMNNPYYLVPDGEVGQQAFAVIRESIRKEGMVALGKVVFTTREHVIADLSANHFERHALRCGFSVERIEHDYGLDLVLFTYDRYGEIENGQVFIQLKASDHLDLSAGRDTFPFQVKRADLEYWLREPWPVILVLYDARRDRAYWLYLQAYFEALGLDIGLRPGRTATVRVPISIRRRGGRKIALAPEEPDVTTVPIPPQYR